MLEGFRLAKFRLEVEAREPLHLSRFIGSTLRGGFGYTFKGLVCIVEHRNCSICLLRDRCVYPYIFETPVPPGSARMRRYRTAPHPFVLAWDGLSKNHFAAGERFAFELTLIGRAIDYLPYFIYVFDELGRRGLGRARGRYELLGIYSIAPDSTEELIYSGRDKTLKSSVEAISGADLPRDQEMAGVTLRFVTPTRIIYSGQHVLDLEFHILIRNLLRRISNLSYFHCGQELDLDFKGLIARAEGVRCVRRELAWRDLERYSTRQEAKMKLGGFVGEASFEGALGDFMPFLRLGEHIHVGKGTSFGLGRYRIVK